jgi:hypothetical protein
MHNVYTISSAAYFYSAIRERLGHEYRADTGTSASDEDGLAKQSGCVEDGHR